MILAESIQIFTFSYNLSQIIPSYAMGIMHFWPFLNLHNFCWFDKTCA